MSNSGMSDSAYRPLPRTFSVLVGCTTLAILIQAVTAGMFVNQGGRDSWVSVHGVIADITWVIALITAIVGFRQVRRGHLRLWLGSLALFVLALVQTGIGHLISDGGMDSLIVVHVPLAMLIFAFAIWLSIATAQVRRGTAVSPYGDDASQPAREPFPTAYRR
jgi:ABC-type uncharacterized transport system permease subunit